MNFARAMRLIWIDAALQTRLRRRADLVAAFGISVPQASSDLTAFAGMFPNRMTYDRSAKAYRAKSTMAAYEPALHGPVLSCQRAVRQAGGPA